MYQAQRQVCAAKRWGLRGRVGNTPGVKRWQTSPHPGHLRHRGGRRGTQSCGGGPTGWARAHWIAPHPQPCTWQPPPPSRFSSLAIPRPPSIRPPHRKLFLINENGKLGPHITGSAWQRQQREPLPRAAQPGVRVARAWRGPHPYCSGLVGVQREPKPLETPAGRIQVRGPRSRCSRRRAASVNSLRHLATASGNAARAPSGCGPCAPLPGRPGKKAPLVFQGVVSG